MISPVNAVRLRRPTWRLAPTLMTPSVDDGPDRLRALAATAVQRARTVLLARVTAACSEPHRVSYSAVANDRVWSTDAFGKPCWCVLDESSQRALLEHVLAGPGAAAPTAVERTIVSECIGRLLGSLPTDEWNEAGRLPFSDTWKCCLDIGGANGKYATLALYTVAEQEPAVGRPTCLDDVPIDLVVRFDGVGVRLNELARWTPGSILRLGRAANDLRATLAPQRGPRAMCDVGESNGRRAISLLGPLRPVAS